MGYMILNVCTDVNACDCTRGCADTVRESALKADSGRNIPCRTGDSNLRQRRASPMIYQLSYILTPFFLFFLLHKSQRTSTKQTSDFQQTREKETNKKWKVRMQ